MQYIVVLFNLPSEYIYREKTDSRQSVSLVAKSRRYTYTLAVESRRWPNAWTNCTLLSIYFTRVHISSAWPQSRESTFHRWSDLQVREASSWWGLWQSEGGEDIVNWQWEPDSHKSHCRFMKVRLLFQISVSIAPIRRIYAIRNKYNVFDYHADNVFRYIAIHLRIEIYQEPITISIVQCKTNSGRSNIY